jgi:alcohol dehydrogenase class IV
MTALRFQHATPALRTFCGPDALAALPAQLDRAGVRRVVIFCDPSIPRWHGDALKRVESTLGERLAAMFADVEPHSPLPAVEAAARLLAEVRADAVIAVGGGSAVVTARAASILLAEKRDVRDLCTRRETDGRLSSPRLSAPKLPQWIVPTTPTTAYARAGSAVRDPATGERLALFDPQTRAQGIFFDPALALTAPVGLARSAALNAFAMAVEGLQAKTDDPLAEALLTHALDMLVESLPRLESAPEDPEVRLRLMLAALLSGQGSEYTSGGLAQALSHATGPRSTVANGVVEALLLPHTMRYNAPVTGQRLERIGTIVSRRSEGATSSQESAVTAVERLLRSVGVPLRLRDVGVAGDSLPEIIAHALDDWFITRVPRTVDRHDLEGLLHAAW